MYVNVSQNSVKKVVRYVCDFFGTIIFPYFLANMYLFIVVIGVKAINVFHVSVILKSFTSNRPTIISSQSQSKKLIK